LNTLPPSASTKAPDEPLWKLLARNYTSVLETTAKISFAILATLYVVGLLVSNAYLTTLGITDFSLLRVRCIFTGLWAIPITVIACLPVVGFGGYKSFQQFRKPFKSTVFPFVAWGFLYVGGELFLAGFAVLFNDYLLSQLSDSGKVTEAFGFFPVGNAVRAAFHIEKDVLIGVTLMGVALMSVRKNVRLPILFTIAITIGFLDLPLHAYRIVRNEFGGGAAIRVQIVFTNETPDISQLGYKRNGQISTELSLLYENENRIVLREETCKRLLIVERKAVIAIFPLLRPDREVLPVFCKDGPGG
jgi:hypothetical protein